MTDQPVPVGAVPNEEDDAPPRLPWELPEIVAVAVLVAFFLLVVGGLVTAIVTGTAPNGSPSPGNQLIGMAIQYGTEWAEPLLAVVLLAVLGLCWWQFQTWADVAETTGDDQQAFDAQGHIHRARQITIWTQAALALTALGSLAFFAGGVLSATGYSRFVWSHDFYEGASALAVIVLAGVGLLVGKRLGQRYAAVGPDEEAAE
jgi:hypothetical protein